MTLLQISQLGHPVLRQKAAPVPIKDIKNKDIQDLIDNMIETGVDNGGVGIAAPQVFQSLQIFIISSKSNPWYPKAPTVKPTAIINPTIISLSKDKDLSWEGCLSFPGVKGRVSRHKTVTATFLDRNGKQKQKTFKGLLARVFQHEFDHLQGIMFTDITDPKTFVTEKEYQKILRKASKK